MYVLADRKLPLEMSRRLEEMGYTVIPTMEVAGLLPPLSTHPDLQFHLVDKKCAVCAPETYRYYRRILPDNIFLLSGRHVPQGTYPADAAYNVARIGTLAVGNRKTADPVILAEYQRRSIPFLHVNQGYTKCSLCVLNEHAVMTSDPGIIRALKKTENNIECFQLKSGEIGLNGFPYGFIGGAGGVEGRKVVFCGSLKQHSQEAEIKSFLSLHQMNPVELSQHPLHDYGSLLFF